MDILIPYVDGSRKKWQEDYIRATQPDTITVSERKSVLDAVANRFISDGLFKFWWRALSANYMSLGKVHLLLADEDQFPDFLADDPRIIVHYHREFMPESILPCFNSSAIELYAMLNLDLPENYILANDDMYFNRKVDDSVFLSSDGKPLTTIKFRDTYGNTLFQRFLENGRLTVEKVTGKKCPIYEYYHLLQVYNDRFCKDFLSKCQKELGRLDKVRQPTDINHLMLMMAQNLEGISSSSDRFPHVGYYSMGTASGLPMHMLLRYDVICLNDTARVGIHETERYLTMRYPAHCEFELEEPEVYDPISSTGFDHDVIIEPSPAPVEPVVPGREMWIHWYYMPRYTDCLGRCETFHFNMLRLFAVPYRVDIIHIRVVTEDGKSNAAIETAKELLGYGTAEIDIKIRKNSTHWEHDTFKEAVEYALTTGKFVYYTHFKGMSRINDPIMKKVTRNLNHGRPLTEDDIFYWSYLMYRGLFSAPICSKAIGPLYRDGNLSGYHDVDHSWCHRNFDHHYAGSFIGFDGKQAKANLELMGLGTVEVRKQKLWTGNRYVPEMFLTMVFDEKDVHFLLVGKFVSYRMYSAGHFAPYVKAFNRVDTAGVIHVETETCDKAVLTYIYGKNEILRPILNREDGVDYVCVTDDPELHVDGWRMVVDQNEWLSDPRSKYSYAKLHPFSYTGAKKVLVIDSSYQVGEGVSEFIDSADGPISLKIHPIRKSIGEEIPQWVETRGMKEDSVKKLKQVCSIMHVSMNSKLYELDVSVWTRCDDAIRFGDEVWNLMVSCASHGEDTMLSNQMAASAIAAKLFKDAITEIKMPVPWIKYRHGSWIS